MNNYAFMKYIITIRKIHIKNHILDNINVIIFKESLTKKLHIEDGPAIEYDDRVKAWYKFGIRDYTNELISG